MKYFASIFFFILIAGSSFLYSQNSNAQIYTGHKADAIAQGAELVRMKDFSSVPNYIRFRDGSEIAESKAFDYCNRFIETQKSGFSFVNKTQDKLGQTHRRYVQTFEGIPLEFSAYLFHMENGKCIAMNGNICSDPEISGEFSISPAAALEAGKAHINAETWIFDEDAAHPYHKEYDAPVPEKVYCPQDGNLYSTQFRAAYKMDLFALQPYSRQYLYVDAETGEVLHSQTRIHTADVPGTAQTAYSGQQSITTDSYGGSYRLRESGRGNGIMTYNCENTANYNTAVDFTDADNTWDSFDPEIDRYATDAHFAAERTYDYFFNVHGRNSIDGNGLALESYVHFSLIDYGYDNNINAFWNGEYMTYGDGSEDITPLTTVDISAHEITHGLTSYTCNLVYQDEPGALNESFSDIFGATVEFYAVPAYADWTIGEDIGSSFRSLANPKAYGNPDTYQGEYWHWDASDNGGVHTNMSVLCYWYYLLCEGNAGSNDNGDAYDIDNPIGMDAAADIAFRMQTVYFTSTTECADARFFGIQSAIDYHGACSNEVGTVTDAFYAIGIGDAYIDSVIADFTANYTENCEAPFTVQFENLSNNGSSYLWDFGDGNTSDAVNPSYTYTSEGVFDVQLTAYGGDCGEASETKTAYISIGPDYPCMTLMPQSGSASSSQCFGSLYDTGGPDSNYPDQMDASFTIEPPGATQIVMNIASLDIEAGSGSSCDYDYIAFYDGNSTSAPLINDTYYCNTTGNPGTISSSSGSITIQFHSDQAVNESGFQIDWECIQEDEPPVAGFSVNAINSCNGRISFYDESLNFPDSWEWDFGDGNTSTQINPMHVFAQNGTYTVSLTVANEHGEDMLSRDVEINMEPALDIEDQTVCLDSGFTLEIESASDNINWYNDEECTNIVHSGATWEHTPLSQDTMYYLREIFPAAVEPVGETEFGSGGYFGNVNYVHYLVFDAYEPFTLLSAKVHAEYAGERSIAVRDENQNILDIITVNIPGGESRIDLNLQVPEGEDLQLVGMAAPDLYRTNEAADLNYPYTIQDVLSIKHSSATTPTGYYYYFYDWNIQQETCESETAEMQITVDECTSVNENTLEKLNLYPNPTDGLLHIENLNNFPVKVQVTDSKGVIIFSEEISKPQLNLYALPDGVYFIRVQNDRQVAHYRVILK